MSQTFDTTLNNIRWIINDRDPGNPIVDRERVKRLLNAVLQRVASQVGITKTSQTVTLVTGTQAYVLDTSVEYLAVHQVIDVNGDPLPKVELSQLHDLYEPTTTGAPQVWSEYPTASQSTSSSQKTTLKIAPTPSANENGDTLTVWYTAIPADVSTEASGIGFNNLLSKAIEKDVAIQLLSGATPAQLDKLGLSINVIPVWQTEVSQLIHEARLLVRRKKRQGSRYVLGVD